MSGTGWDNKSQSGFPIATSFIRVWSPDADARPEVVAAQTKSERQIYLSLQWERRKVKIKAYTDGALDVDPFSKSARIVGTRCGMLILGQRGGCWQASSAVKAVEVREWARRKGVATAMYDVVDYLTEEGTRPARTQTESGKLLWESRLQYRRLQRHRE